MCQLVQVLKADQGNCDAVRDGVVGLMNGRDNLRSLLRIGRGNGAGSDGRISRIRGLIIVVAVIISLLDFVGKDRGGQCQQRNTKLHSEG